MGSLHALHLVEMTYAKRSAYHFRKQTFTVTIRPIRPMPMQVDSHLMQWVSRHFSRHVAR